VIFSEFGMDMAAEAEDRRKLETMRGYHLWPVTVQGNSGQKGWRIGQTMGAFCEKGIETLLQKVWRIGLPTRASYEVTIAYTCEDFFPPRRFM
jgi:hypothetical protein